MKEERKLTWEEHLAALTSYLDEKGIDLAYVAEPVDIAYLTGYSSWTEERVFALLPIQNKPGPFAGSGDQ